MLRFTISLKRPEVRTSFQRRNERLFFSLRIALSSRKQKDLNDGF